MKEDTKQLNIYAAEAFSLILKSNPDAISVENRDRLIKKSFQIAKELMSRHNKAEGY